MIVVFVGLFGVWIALARRFDPLSISVGGLVAAGVALLQWRLFPRVNRALLALFDAPTSSSCSSGSSCGGWSPRPCTRAT